MSPWLFCLHLPFFGVPAGLAVASPTLTPAGRGFGPPVILEGPIPLLTLRVMTTVAIRAVHITADLTEAATTAGGVTLVVEEDIIDRPLALKGRIFPGAWEWLTENRSSKLVK